MTTAKKIHDIATRYYEDKTDDRPFEEIHAQMVDFAKKGWLSQEWIDGAHRAMATQECVVFHHDPDKNAYGWLAGSKKAMAKVRLGTE